jgi:multicomponent Na+:H+ antiporter subunit E
MSHADRPGWRAWVRRVVLFAVLWWVLTDGATGAWFFGVPVILLGAWSSLFLWTRQPLSLRGLVRFLPYFALQSLAGATDVARRALDPAMPLFPGLVRHRLRLPAGAARITLANVISMLPGTLSADLAGDDVLVHALDTRNDVHAMVLDLEPRIAAVFGVVLPPLPTESASC